MDGVSAVDSSLKRVAVVEDFFDIIYAMHVEMGGDPRKASKHAGQKKTYRAVSRAAGRGRPRPRIRATACLLLALHGSAVPRCER